MHRNLWVERNNRPVAALQQPEQSSTQTKQKNKTNTSYHCCLIVKRGCVAHVLSTYTNGKKDAQKGKNL
jgi:hypothetical protein